MIAVCTLGCTRKRKDIYSWPYLTNLQGDYRLYINWEIQNLYNDASFVPMEDYDYLCKQFDNLQDSNKERIIDVDAWRWEVQFGTQWRNRPKFDQDQARLSSIVTARNMCIEYALQTDCSHLLFIDADIIP